MTADLPRYPQARVRLHSHNPLALIGAVREALRRAGAGKDDLDAFCRGASTLSDHEIEPWCRQWTHLDLYPLQQSSGPERMG